jgi:WD40 repeat protein
MSHSRISAFTLLLLLGAAVTVADEPATYKGHTAAVNALAFSPNGKLLVSAGDDNLVLIWTMATQGCGNAPRTPGCGARRGIFSRW